MGINNGNRENRILQHILWPKGDLWPPEINKFRHLNVAHKLSPPPPNDISLNSRNKYQMRVSESRTGFRTAINNKPIEFPIECFIHPHLSAAYFSMLISRSVTSYMAVGANLARTHAPDALRPTRSAPVSEHFRFPSNKAYLSRPVRWNRHSTATSNRQMPSEPAHYNLTPLRMWFLRASAFLNVLRDAIGRATIRRTVSGHLQCSLSFATATL